MENYFAMYNTKFGPIKISYINDTVTFLKRTNDINNKGRKTNLTENVFKQINEYLNGQRKYFDFKYELIGTEFQKKVWNELLNIPYGETRSYKEIAIAIGNKNASRAVGMANNKNPITIVVPCHRVIGSSGKLTGYFGGIEMKKELLYIEEIYK